MEAKIILDDDEVSKGYGFITFMCEEDIENALNQGDIMYMNKKLNLGPIVKKQKYEGAI